MVDQKCLLVIFLLDKNCSIDLLVYFDNELIYNAFDLVVLVHEIFQVHDQFHAQLYLNIHTRVLKLKFPKIILITE